MSKDISAFIIQPTDVLQSLLKWDGRDAERFWQATDREFLEGFATGEITEKLLSRFAARNDNKVATKRSGGYSVTRKFWGGISSWSPRLQDFYKTRILPCRNSYRLAGSIEAVWALTTELAEMKGQSAKGFESHLGIVAASKLLFFSCPEMPIFIYDSVVGVALSTAKLPMQEYPKWWNSCNELLKKNQSAVLLLPKDRQNEFLDKEEWFTRRALDLMLYRHGERAAIDYNCH